MMNLTVNVVAHTSQQKKMVLTNFELFHIREKQIPCDVVELKDTKVDIFSWEPSGNKVCC